MRVLVTGSSSHFAAALLPRLCAEPRVSSVTGVDLKPPHFRHAKFRAHPRDIRDPGLASLLRNHDALIHLAFVVLRGRVAEREMEDINVGGTAQVFRAARDAGVRRLIHMSSAAVYGGGVNLSEDAPLAPLPGFLYAKHKARLEAMLAAEFPEALRLRPHAILGRNAQPLLKQLLAQPCYLRLPEPHPLLQCVHEDDVVEAVLRALRSNLSGPLNLAAPDTFSFRDAIRQQRRRFIFGVPPAAARAGLKLAWRMFGWGGEPAWLEGLVRTLVLDCTRAAVELGWRPANGGASAVAAARYTARELQ